VSTATEPSPLDAAAGTRPAKPGPDWTVWAGLAVVVVISIWSANQIGFTLRPLWENLAAGRDVLTELVSPNWSFIGRIWPRLLETLYIAVIAGLLGNAGGLFFSLLASKITSPNRVVYQVFKTALSVVRSLPDVAYGLLFVVAVGSGALAGILALIMFNLGVNAKLTAETIDGVDVGPIEAADAAGANRFQRAWVAVVPQILPSYMSYSLYVFELNLRASVVLGIVGAGGIGQVIRIQLSQLQWGNLGAVIAVLFVIVFVLDRVSIYIRRRLV
jgi:phosphonate transport system permease protein